MSDEEKKRLGFEVKDDGSFWMTVKDWVDEFEVLTICALPGMDLEDEDGHFTEEYAAKPTSSILIFFLEKKLNVTRELLEHLLLE